MIFEFVSTPYLKFMPVLAERLGAKFENNTIILPDSLGNGYIKFLDLGTGFKIIRHRYVLNDDLVFKRLASAEKTHLVTITFNTLDKPLVFLQPIKNSDARAISISPIHITSTDIDLETRFLAHKNIHSTVILIHAEQLSKLLEGQGDSRLLKSITAGDSSFWFDTLMTIKIKNILAQIDEGNNIKVLDRFFYRVKAHELIFYLFEELLKKEDGSYQSLQKDDIEKMYQIKEIILYDLSKPPTLLNLANTTGMSETKMKQLFRQIFGSSIYKYFQAARMVEAARLLELHSVADAGYKLGFTNMSHFSRLFEKHHSKKPKKYKNSNQIPS